MKLKENEISSSPGPVHTGVRLSDSCSRGPCLITYSLFMNTTDYTKLLEAWATGGGVAPWHCCLYTRVLEPGVFESQKRSVVHRMPSNPYTSVGEGTRTQSTCTRTHQPWIYRTLMHNALRDDGKYGYITRQRPMLFSLASHWLMLIRNQRNLDERAERRRGTFIKANPSLCYSSSSLPWKTASLRSREIALQFRGGSSLVIRNGRLPSEYEVLVLRRDF